MNSSLEEIREKQKGSWNKFSPGWKKWDDLTMKFLKPYGDSIIEHLQPQGKDKILDIAAGTGEPGLTIASMIPEGAVTICDLSEGMLEVARGKANRLKFENVKTKIVDACALPFEDDSFDAVSCRFGLMFFPDMLMAIKEMARVVKPGGRIAATVWGDPAKNYWVTSMVQNIKAHIEMPTPPEGAPGMFRCAAPGLIEGLFKESNIKNVIEKEILGSIDCSSADEYWDFMTDVAAPFASALGGADEETVERVRVDLVNSLNQKYPNEMSIGTSGILISGEF